MERRVRVALAAVGAAIGMLAAAWPVVTVAEGVSQAQVRSHDGVIVFQGSSAADHLKLERIQRRHNYVIFRDRAGLAAKGSCERRGSTRVACRTEPAIEVYGRGGDDRIRVTHQSRGELPIVIWGNGGADLLIAGPRGSEMVGGKGADRLRGGRGRDELRGSGGRDSLHGGRGRDEIFGADGPEDPDRAIDCGRGFDRGNADRDDPKPRGCENPLHHACPVCQGSGLAKAGAAQGSSRSWDRCDPPPHTFYYSLRVSRVDCAKARRVITSHKCVNASCTRFRHGHWLCRMRGGIAHRTTRCRNGGRRIVAKARGD